MVYFTTEIDVEAVQRMAKAMSNPLRVRIVAGASLRTMSPRQFFDECNVEGHSLSTVGKHFRKLAGYGYLDVIERKSGDGRRGGVETFYRASRRTVFDEATWPNLPLPVKSSVTFEIFRAYVERMKRALTAGTIDERDDRHFTWSSLLLDEQGWKELIGKIDALFYEAFEIADEAGKRLGETGGQPIHMTFALAGFESPLESLDTSGSPGLSTSG